MVTVAFVCLLVCVVIQRLIEVEVSRRNEAELLRRGAREHAAQQMTWMIALHASWLVCTLLEVTLLDRPFYAWLAVPALVVLCLGQGLRLTAIQELGERWTVKVITLPRTPPVSGGIFRYMRHPNYLGVVLEIVALPLVHGAWLSALTFSIANGLLLRARIRAEEQALREAGDYDVRFAKQPRLWPSFAQGREEVLRERA